MATLFDGDKYLEIGDMRRIPITRQDECESIHDSENDPNFGRPLVVIGPENPLRVIAVDHYTETPVYEGAVSVGQGSSKRGYTPRPYFGRTEYICIAVIVAFAGWVAVEIWRNW